MECEKVRGLLPGYLDGALPSVGRSDSHVIIGQHLQFCEGCREELQQYIEVSSLISCVQRPVPPPDLALRIRVAAAQRLSEKNWLHYARMAQNRSHLVLKNILEPLALPASGGLIVALVVFSLVYQVLGVGMPLGAVTSDSPTNLLQPARLESLAPFPLTDLEDLGHSGPHVLMVEAIINAEGEAVSYEIISGPDTLRMRRQLDMMLLFSRFRPQLSFGRPTAGGHVVLSFSNISIKG